MLAIAILAIGLAYVANRWRRGQFAFQQRHAELAIFCDSEVRWAEARLNGLREHHKPGHICSTCPEDWQTPLDIQWEVQAEKYRSFSREAWWHSLIAGPLVNGPNVDRERGPPPPRSGYR